MPNILIQIFRIINKVDDIDPENFFTFNDNVTRGHIFKIQKPSVRKAKRQNSFPVRAIDNWNSLEMDIVCSDSVISLRQSWIFPGVGKDLILLTFISL